MTTDPRAALRYWIARYDTLYAERRWAPLHDIAASLFVLGVLAVLKGVPVPDALARLSPLLDWSTLLLLVLVVYQCILSLPLALATLPVAILMAVATAWLASRPLATSLVGVHLLIMGLCLDVVAMRQKRIGSLIEFVQLAALAPLWRMHHSVQLR
ncbi:MAG: hypothetical protein AAGF46_03925 [Pseudomonadota bacterium]